ncbi:uncharacterized protein [Anoplolepis gracilipes]|uniref:uncharacterized protein n=1 Tax=Anoplolepis gracilipes TaxID=354296 RepID=UPI003BA0DAE2
MIDIETKYFNLNRILLLIIGLWPYQQSNFTRLQFICLSCILTTHVIFQCTIFISQKCTPDLITKVLSSIFFYLLFVIKYNMFSVKAVKDLLEELLHVYNGLIDKTEIAIVDEYGRNSKRYTIALTIFAVIIMFAFIVASFWSNILNIFFPTNVSRSHHLLIMTEYFFDDEEYVYFILFHSIASMCIGTTTAVATGTMFLSYLQHVCGMFKIASYRIQCAMSTDMLQNINLRKQILIFKSLICAVNIHREAMKLSKHLQYSCETMMFFLVLFGVVSLSLNLFRIASTEEVILPFLGASAAILYMFLANYICQIVMNHNHDVYVTAYNARWYVAPLHIQRMILFLLQRQSKTFNLGVGGLFIASIECFATLVKTSISYFTVIYSTRK